jgi:hypothetical protein
LVGTVMSLQVLQNAHLVFILVFNMIAKS